MAGVAVALIAFLLLRARARDEAVALALFAAGAIALGLPARMDRPGLAGRRGAGPHRRSPPLVAPVASSWPSCARASARHVARLALLIAAGLFGCWVRAYFLPSAGSWDVDFWRTAMLHGKRTRVLGGAYGGPDDVPEGHLLAQLTGKRDPSPCPQILGRPIVVNYPPLAVAMWTRLLADGGAMGASASSPSRRRPWPPRLARSPVTSLAVAVLLWIHRRPAVARGHAGRALLGDAGVVAERRGPGIRTAPTRHWW